MCPAAYRHSRRSRRCVPPLQSRPDKPFRLAVGSFIDDYANKVEIIQCECLFLGRRCAARTADGTVLPRLL